MVYSKETSDASSQLVNNCLFHGFLIECGNGCCAGGPGESIVGFKLAEEIMQVNSGCNVDEFELESFCCEQ